MGGLLTIISNWEPSTHSLRLVSKMHKWYKRRRQRIVEPHTASAKCQPDPPGKPPCFHVLKNMWKLLMFHKLKTVNQVKASGYFKKMYLDFWRFLFCWGLLPVDFVVTFVMSVMSSWSLLQQVDRPWNFATKLPNPADTQQPPMAEKCLATAFNRPRDNVVKSQKNEHSPHVLLVFNRRFLAIKQLTMQETPA